MSDDTGLRQKEVADLIRDVEATNENACTPESHKVITRAQVYTIRHNEAVEMKIEKMPDEVANAVIEKVNGSRDSFEANLWGAKFTSKGRMAAYLMRLFYRTAMVLAAIWVFLLLNDKLPEGAKPKMVRQIQAAAVRDAERP